MPDFRFSILDLAPIAMGSTAAQALRQSLDLAQHAERWGYLRFWVAEHHNIPGVASAATSVVIGYLAGGTSRIRVGSGGIMLPNHAPLVIAEQFGTLDALYPGRIDLGIGRAPGGDPATMRALRRGLNENAETFPRDLAELQGYLGVPEPGQSIRATPGQGSRVPVYLLGSSTFSARLAAQLGLPFAFASHFAPDLLFDALAIYREHFQPSKELAAPYAMLGVNVFAADSDAEATQLFTTLQQMFLNLIRGRPQKMPPPAPRLDWSSSEEASVNRMTRISAVGGPDSVREQLRQLWEQTGVQEMILTTHIFEHTARLHSFEIAADVLHNLTLRQSALSS